MLPLNILSHIVSELNSQMRRIDLFCKLVGPLAIALVDGYSTRVAILVVLSMTAMSAGVEYFAIAQVASPLSIISVTVFTNSSVGLQKC